ncbi:DEAD/DEAH box helicase [Amylibacter sp. SFDW26]|nr:DEAD/DEAH box helicase [Amylibacter sp. SFDW26]KAB7613989.1 DEAD/DEAH box helicase [Amylibacter sp. SFDW26]
MIKTLSDAIKARGYDTLTPVQEAVTQPELGEADLLVSAQTGSGKTVGFGLAIAPTLLGDMERFPKASKPLALIIAPTRELALQVKRELEWLYGKAGATIASCVGGMDMRDERRTLERGAHIVVGTPGRLRDHIGRRSLNMNALRAVVLDEADEMLDLGFREDLEMILGEAPEDRRTLMFSATVPRSIATLAQHYQKDAVRVTTKAEASQHSDIEYRAMNVSARDGENAIINVLRFYESPTAIVFCNTRAMVNRLTTRFSNRGFSVVALSGELSQNERTHALQAMRDGRARVCIATDVAARGIDLPNLELVIHAELPSSHETLLHRSGRTGRAGRKGVSALIVPAKSRRKAERILKSAKVTAEWSDAPSADAVIARDEERLMNDPTWQQDISEKEQAGAQKLAELYSAEQIAAAYLRLYNSRQSAPEELSASGSDGAPQKRAAFGASVWFSLAGGRKDNAEARRILPMICKAGGITKEDVGAIRVQQNETFIEIRKSSVDAFVKAMGPDLNVEAGATLIQLDKAPKITASPRPNSGGRHRDNKPRGGGKEKPQSRSHTRSDKDYWDHNSGQEPSKKRPKGGSKSAPFAKKRPEDDLLGDGAVKRLKKKSESRAAKGKSKAAIAKGKRKKARTKAERSK